MTELVSYQTVNVTSKNKEHRLTQTKFVLLFCLSLSAHLTRDAIYILILIYYLNVFCFDCFLAFLVITMIYYFSIVP